jgi:PAS domain S-box-containing protein
MSAVSARKRLKKEKVPRKGQGPSDGQAKVQGSNGGPYAQMVEAANQAIFVIQDGRLKFANSRARVFLGQPIENLTPELLLSLVHPEDRALIRDRYERRVRGEDVPRVYSLRLVNDRGETRWVEFNVNLIHWDGRPATLTMAENITHRQQMEMELKEGERTIRALLDASPNVEFLIDTQGKILAANEAFRRAFGKEGHPVEGLNITAMTYPEEAKVNAEKSAEVIRTGKPVLFEHEFGGMWVEKSFYPILDDQGRVTKLACYGRVITEQKQAEQALRESERRYRMLADNATDFIWTMDWNLRLTYVSPGVTRLRGYTPEEVMAEALENAFTPDSWAVVQKMYAEALAEERRESKDLNRTLTLELEHRCKDGSTVWAESKISAIRDAEGRIVEILGVNRDITERKKAGEALRESEKTVRALLDASPAAEFLIDTRGVILATNRTFDRIYGGDGKTLLGRNINDLVSPEENQDNLAKASEVLRTGKPAFFEDRQQGLWLEKVMYPIMDESGRVTKIAFYGRNITERRKAEETVRRLAEENAVMAKIGRIISSSLNIEEVYERFAQEVRKLIEFENITVGMINPEERSLAITHVFGVPVAGREVGALFPLDGTAAEEIYKTRASLFIQKENLEEAARKIPKLRTAFEAGMQSLIIVPLIWEDRVIGILNILSSKPSAYTRADVKIAEEVAMQITGAIANAQLFSERQRAQEATQRAQRLFSTIFRLNPAAVIFSNLADGRCVDVNEAYAKLTGYTREELLGKTTVELNIWISEEERTRVVTELAQKGRQENVELTLRRKNGEFIDTIAGGEVISLEGQQYIISFFVDITERKKAEEDLRESEQKFRELFNNASDAIFLHELKGEGEIGRFLEVNDVACRKLGYSRQECLTLSPWDIIFVSQDDNDLSKSRLIGRIREALRAQGECTFEVSLVGKNGQQIPMEINALVFASKQGKMILSIARDVTDRKMAEQELAEYQAYLEKTIEERTARIQELERQRGEIEKLAATGLLAARIAHEINNPLAGIKGSFMLIQDAVPPTHPYHRYVGLIHSEITRIARVVRQMFELYRPPEGEQEEWRIDQMVQDVVSLLKDETRDRKVSFQFDIPALDLRLPAGPVRQVLFNILKNAVEASPLEGVVNVSAREQGEGVTIQVHDQGPGIPEANRPHVFKPFFTTKVDTHKGLGLGLSISHDIVKTLGGSIRFTSRRREGTIFQISLPGKEKKEGG